jgi:diacylglycerol kinase (ATP)
MFAWYRWKIEVRPYRHLGIRLPVRNMFMYNYLSVGVDAQVTLDFHHARESPFYIISSRLINKVIKFSARFLAQYFALMPCWLAL